MAELSAPVDLCGSDGRLNPAAVGWSRRPLHRCALPGPWGRRKRWHHWCVATRQTVITMTIADLDYVALAAVFVLDLETGRSAEKVALRRPASLPDDAGGGVAAVEGGALALCFTDQGDRVRLEASSARIGVDVMVERPEGHETLGVVVPWSDTRFQYTSKQNALPATGSLRVDGIGQSIDGAFAALDFGRGVWPAWTTWNWASASGVSGGRTIGLNLGGRWTDGTGQNENAVCVDGKLMRLGDVRFAYDRRAFLKPWTISGPEVELRFEPRREKPLFSTHVCFGRFWGTVAGLEVRDLPGSAEELKILW